MSELRCGSLGSGQDLHATLGRPSGPHAVILVIKLTVNQYIHEFVPSTCDMFENLGTSWYKYLKRPMGSDGISQLRLRLSDRDRQLVPSS